MRQEERSGFGLLAARIGTHSLLYIASAVLTLALGLATVVVVTHYLAPGDFGDLAVLTVSASLLTIAYNAGSLQGTFSWVFGTTGDEDAPDEASATTAPDPRRALTTGFAITGALAIAGSAVVAAAAGPLSAALLDEHDDRRLVLWTAVAAGAAALWRLAANCIRLQRRPVAYAVATAANGVLGLAATLALLEAGAGLEGAVAGLALGAAGGAAVAVALIRRDLAMRVSRNDAANIVRRGRALVLVVGSFSTIQLCDVLLLSRFVPAADVGIYRVAARIGALVSYWTSSFHMAWGSLRRDPLHVAADIEDSAPGVAARLTTYFVVLTTGVVLATALFADELVAVAAAPYADAAAYLPLTAIGFALHGVYVLAYRTAEFPDKRRWFVRLSVASAAVFVLVAVVAIPALGVYGAPAAVAAGWLVGILGMWWLGQARGNAVPYDYRRLAATLAIGGGCYAAAATLAPRAGAERLAVELACLAAYGLVLAAFDVLPRRDAAAAVRAARRRPGAAASLAVRVAGLAPDERRTCALLLHDDRGVADVSASLGMDPDSLLGHFVAALRKVEGLGPPRDSDPALGDYLLLDATFAQRERRAAALYRDSVDPLELERLTRSVRRLRRLPKATWETPA